MGKGQASCTLESVFLSAGKLNGLSLSSSDVLDRVLVCILSQSLSSCVFLFVSNPRFLSLFCQSAFAPYFLQVFAFYVFFWILRLFFAHCSDFCILSQVIGQMCFWSVKMHRHVGQTNKQAFPPRHFSNDQNTLIVENCWEKRLHTDREREWVGQRGVVRRLGE